MFKQLRLRWRRSARFAIVLLILLGIVNLAGRTWAQGNVMDSQTLPRGVNRTVPCEILITGGGIAGVATAYEALQTGRTVCMTDITDWVGGQLTSQGTSALDEAKRQRALLFYARGYNELRQRIEQKYGKLNPGECWVSVSCFLPNDAQQILMTMLKEAAKKGQGNLQWFPATVIKDLEISADGKLIQAAIAIQHRPAPETLPLNTEPLSQTIEDVYRYENSSRLTKQIIRFVPRGQRWIVVDATETGELIAIADVPYRVGLDPRTYLNPSSPTETGDPYCLQGFTYTFAMEQTETPQPQQKPSFYEQYAPYYGYDADYRKADFNFVFTYRRIWSPKTGPRIKAGPLTVTAPTPGDISMQNWVWGNDYRPGTALDNLVYSRQQLQQTGQLSAGNWMGGLRTDALRKAEELAFGFYYWLVEGTTDSQLGPGFKEPEPNHRLLKGLETPMGTAHGLSKYPYMREGRRLIGRSSAAYPNGFSVNEIDVSRADYRQEYYRNLPASLYRSLWVALAGLETGKVIVKDIPADKVTRRTRSTIYPDSVGIAQYAIDFHPCMQDSPPEKPGNIERPGVRQAHGQSYPGQIPLRSMIPQRLDNLLVASKSIATSFIAAADYRVHSFEWSVGAAAGTTADFALSEGLLPYQLVDDLSATTPALQKLQKRLNQNGNPTAFPNTSIFNEKWEDWTVW